jgi:SAM-dependent methyltransferase
MAASWGGPTVAKSGIDVPKARVVPAAPSSGEPLNRSELLVRGSGYSAARLDARMRWVFDGVPLAGKRMLEIGSGDGLFACWAVAVGGAASATGLEPEASGSSSGVLGRFRERTAGLGLDNVRVLPATFQEFAAPPGSFDIVFSYASINHLSEPDCMRLHRDRRSRSLYVDLCRKMFTLLAPGGRLLITDCSRHNLFSWPQRLGWVRNPLQPTIEWEKHQSPAMWASVLRDAGFEDLSWRWSRLSPLAPLGRLASNALVAYVTTSGFDLRATRPAGRRDA